MCLSWFCINKDKNDEKSLNEAKDKMIKAVDKLGMKDYDEMMIALEEMCIDIEDIPDEEVDEDDLRKAIINKIDNEAGKEVEIKKAKKKFKEVIELTFDSLGYRDVTWIQHKGEIVYVSGGMSWGDAPTDSYTTFGSFSNLPLKILKAGGIS